MFKLSGSWVWASLWSQRGNSSHVVTFCVTEGWNNICFMLIMINCFFIQRHDDGSGVVRRGFLKISLSVWIFCSAEDDQEGRHFKCAHACRCPCMSVWCQGKFGSTLFIHAPKGQLLIFQRVWCRTIYTTISVHVSYNCQSEASSQRLFLSFSVSPPLFLLESLLAQEPHLFMLFGPSVSFQLVAKNSFLKMNRGDKLKKINETHQTLNAG